MKGQALRTDMQGEGAARVLRRRVGGRVKKGTRQQSVIARPRNRIVRMTDEENVITPLLKGRYPQDQFRHGEYLHVSDLLYRCIRKIALSDRLNEVIHAETVWPGRALTFAFGHTVQDYITGVLKKNAPGQLFGDWECPCGHHKLSRKTWRQVKDTACPVCGHPPIKYNEIVVKDEEYKVSGAIDITLLLEEYFYLTECKSIAAKGWNEIKRPKPEHLLQVLFYWHLYKRAGWPLWDRVSVIYVNKEFMFSGLPYKEFFFQPSVIEDRLDDLISEARELVAYRQNDRLPARTMCVDKDSPDAKKCQFRDICFQMEN